MGSPDLMRQQLDKQPNHCKKSESGAMPGFRLNREARPWRWLYPSCLVSSLLISNPNAGVRGGMLKPVSFNESGKWGWTRCSGHPHALPGHKAGYRVA